MNKVLFERSKNTQKYLEYLNLIKDLNLPINISKWNDKIIGKLCIDNYYDEYIAYKFEVIRKWILQNENLSSFFISKLNKYIRMLRLDSYLNCDEQNYIYQLQSYVFSLSRNIKSLIVDFQLFKNEEAYFHYDRVKVKSRKLKYHFEGELYITNKRIIFSDNIDVHWLNIDNITNIYNVDNVIYINYLNQIIYFPYNDYELLKLSFNKVCMITNRKLRYE